MCFKLLFFWKKKLKKCLQVHWWYQIHRDLRYACYIHSQSDVPIAVWMSSTCISNSIDRSQIVLVLLGLSFERHVHVSNSNITQQNIVLRFTKTWRFTSYASGLDAESRRYSDGFGSWVGCGTRKGSNASKVTIQGEIVVPKFFPRNGPRGWYSNCWISRATQVHISTLNFMMSHKEESRLPLQSFITTIPKIWSSALSTGIRSPNGLPTPTKKA